MLNHALNCTNPQDTYHVSINGITYDSCASCGACAKLTNTITYVSSSAWSKPIGTVPKLDNSKTQPIRNDGERCIYCGKRTKELQLITSITRFCPDCELEKAKPAKNFVDKTDFKLVESDDPNWLDKLPIF